MMLRNARRAARFVARFVGSCVGLVLAFGVVGCLDHELEEGELGDGGQFVVLDSDFANFRSWNVIPHGIGEHDGASGPKNVYINRLPSAGAISFAPGTMVIKTIETANPSGWQAHAMVKRGGDFNLSGAYGWEFFDLKLDASGNLPSILWRGQKPPSGHGYESLPGVESGTKVDCNTCHTSARNDALISVLLVP